MNRKPVYRSTHPEVFLGKSVLEICRKFTGEHPWRSVISIKLQSNFTEIRARHVCSPVNLLLVFWTTFSKNTSEQLFLIGCMLSSGENPRSGCFRFPSGRPNWWMNEKTVLGIIRQKIGRISCRAFQVKEWCFLSITSKRCNIEMSSN